MPLLFRFFALALLVMSARPALAEAPNVVVSIKPLHALVSGVMGDVGTPYLIVKGSGTPHTHALKPSDAKALSDAQLVFWIGEDLERFLKRPLDALADNANTVWMIDAPGLERLGFREGGLFAGQDGEVQGGERHSHEGHDHGTIDMHFWLDPKNASAMVRHIEQSFGEADPGNKARYAANAEALLKRLEQLDAEMEQTLAPVRGKPFVVFHDSYQYFEKRYGVAATGSLTAKPELPPGARHLKAIREAMQERGVACVFAEPQFDAGRVKALVTGSSIRIGILDPLGSGLEPGPELYFTLLRSLAKNLAACLSGAP